MSNLFKNMLLIAISTVLFLTAFLNESWSGIYFMNNSNGINDPSYRKNPCVMKGYVLTSCIGNQVPFNRCSIDNKFFKSCVCNPEKYKYDVYNCSYPKTLSGDSCDGKYEFCSCEAKFQYTSDNCSAPKALSGLSCNGKYENCSCPSEYFKTCSGNMIGDGKSCGGKFKSCKCASIFKTCTSKGPDRSSSICSEENGMEKYSTCAGNSCENAGYIDAVPENQKCREIKYFENTCYADCRPLTCFDGGYYDRDPSKNITCPKAEFGGKSCHDCNMLCGYCEQFTGKCKIECKNDCKKGLWFMNKLNGGFICNIKEENNLPSQ